MSLFDLNSDPGALDGPGGYRHDDPQTSKDAALRPFKRESLRHKLLIAYSDAGPAGLTDEQAGTNAAIAMGGWKRCSELRTLGLIETTGERRESSMGADQQVCRITFAGRRMLGLVETNG